MKKLLLGLVLVVAIFLLQACGGTPANTYEYILDDSYTKFITMGTSADFQPFEYPEEVNGKTTIVGIDIEIAKEVAKSVGKNLRVINKDFDFLIEDLSSGKLDFVMAGLTINEVRKKAVNFSDFYYEAEDVLLIKKTDVEKYKSIEDVNAKNVKVGAQRGTVQIETLNNVLKNSVHYVLPNLQVLVNDLKASKADGILLDRPVAEAFVNEMDELMIANVLFPEKEDKYAIAVNKSSNELLTIVNNTIKELKSSGKLDEIFKTFTEKQ